MDEMFRFARRSASTSYAKTLVRLGAAGVRVIFFFSFYSSANGEICLHSVDRRV